MRVLVVDQDSASNLAITRSLREHCTVDCVTNKGDCLDLLRSNTFEVIVATERLEDGSGLELLGTISKKWPAVLRIFAADRQRLQLLRGRLGPFQLFQTLTYPIDPDRLIATLELAAAAQHADADISNIQQIELTSDGAPQEPEVEAAAEGPGGLENALEVAEPEDFSEPRPAARIASGEPEQAASVGRRAAARGRVAPRSVPAGLPRENGVAGAPRTRSRSDASDGRGIDPPPKFAGSGTISPRRSAASSAGASRSGRSSGVAPKRAPPVRFPPLERIPALERVPPLVSPNEPGRRSSGDSITEAATMARAARSDYEPTSEKVDTRRIAIMVGGGLAVALALGFIGVKVFSSKTESPRPVAPAVAHAPEYPQEVKDLVAQTEAAFKADDLKAARADVDKLRQLSPSHPRLAFLEGLLTSRADTVAKVGASRSSASSRKGGKSSAPATTAQMSPPKGNAGPALASSGTAAPPALDSSKGGPALPPETPSGFSRPGETQHPSDVSSGASGATAGSTQSLDSATGAGPDSTADAAPSARDVAPAAPAPADVGRASNPPSSARRNSGEPPPVIQEANLIRRVAPDYPSAAKRDGAAGFVDLDITVSSQGVVEDATVVQATPPDMFEKAAVAAVRKWKYDPRFVDGLPSQAHLKVRLEFGPGM